LIATERFDLVDKYDASSFSSLHLLQIQLYDAAVIVSSSDLDPVVLGNIIASFIDLGKGVVSTYYDIAGGQRVGGAFNNNTYRVIVPGGQVSTNAAMLGLADLAHPIMQNIDLNTLISGPKTHRPTAVKVTTGSTVVARWNDNNFLVTTKEHIGNNNARRVDLGNESCYL
jgi:hypothetical protein